MFIYICIHLHIMYTYIYIHIYIYIYMYIHDIYIYMYVYMCIYIHMYVYIHIYVCVFTFMYIHIHIHICIYVHVYMCSCIYTYMYAYTYTLLLRKKFLSASRASCLWWSVAQCDRYSYSDSYSIWPMYEYCSGLIFVCGLAQCVRDSDSVSHSSWAMYANTSCLMFVVQCAAACCSVVQCGAVWRSAFVQRLTQFVSHLWIHLVPHRERYICFIIDVDAGTAFPLMKRFSKVSSTLFFLMNVVAPWLLRNCTWPTHATTHPTLFEHHFKNVHVVPATPASPATSTLDLL